MKIILELSLLTRLKPHLGMIVVHDYLYIFEHGFIIRKDNNGASIQQSRVH
jgi:hypothetical protein